MKKEKIFFLLFLFLAAVRAWARPDKLEIWFLSPPLSGNKSGATKDVKSGHLVTDLWKLLGKSLVHKESELGTLTVLAEINWEYLHSNCQPFGDSFFHPQWGVHGHDGAALSPLGMEKRDEEKVLESVPIKSDWEKDLIQCDKKYYFDMFCGQAKAGPKSASILEVWVDTSGSMREIDDLQEKESCFRKSFIKRLKDDCPNGSVEIKTFNTSIKMMDHQNSLCLNHGLNDTKRLIQWIEGTTASKLIVITDIYEANLEISDYISTVGGTLRGDGPGELLTGKNLLELVKQALPFCKR